MVVVHHSVPSLRYYKHIEYDFLIFLAAIGKNGVDFFFVLSGFIICYSNYTKPIGPNRYSKYIIKRLLRVYVPYLPIGLAIYLAYSTLPSLSNSDRSADLFTTLTLIPIGTPALSVAWTLSFELLFYVLFSLFFISGRLWAYFVGTWLISVSVFNYIIDFSDAGWFSKFIFSTYNIEFILGYVICKLSFDRKYTSDFIVFALMIFSGGSFLFMKFYSIEFFYFSTNLVFSVFASLLIYYSVHRLGNVKQIAFFLMVGNISYSLYLVHNPLQGLVVRFSPFLYNELISAVYLILVIFAVTIFIGYVYSYMFERVAFTKLLDLALRRRK
jgi:exopolysaccharide production protein ExoZ